MHKLVEVFAITIACLNFSGVALVTTSFLCEFASLSGKSYSSGIKLHNKASLVLDQRIKTLAKRLSKDAKSYFIT